MSTGKLGICPMYQVRLESRTGAATSSLRLGEEKWTNFQWASNCVQEVNVNHLGCRKDLPLKTQCIFNNVNKCSVLWLLIRVFFSINVWHLKEKEKSFMKMMFSQHPINSPTPSQHRCPYALSKAQTLVLIKGNSDIGWPELAVLNVLLHCWTW